MPSREAVEDFRAVAKRLRDDKGLSLEDVAYQARALLGPAALSLSIIQKRVAGGSDLAPSFELLETLAAGLGVPPETFAEYRLEVAKRALTPRYAGGLDEALRALERMGSLDGR